MPQCRATTKSGCRCRQLVGEGEEYCRIHDDEWNFPRLGSAVAGAAAGFKIGGAVGGLIGGALGYAVPDLWREEEKTCAFTSFDYDNDRALRDFLIGQSRHSDSPFEVVDNSLKEAAPERDWIDKARTAIGRSDVVIVLLGPKTRYARGVLKEVKIANQLGKRMFQLIGYPRGSSIWAVEGAGRVYRWSWENLKKLLAQ